MNTLIGGLAAAALISIGITAALTAVLSRFISSPSATAVLGGLALPMLALGWGVYDLNHVKVNSPPPGTLLLGGLTILSAATPITLLTGFWVVRWQRKRNGSPPRCRRSLVVPRSNMNWIGSPPRLLDELAAFDAMRAFLEAHWERGGKRSDGLAVLLGSFNRDKRTSQPLDVAL